MKKIIIAFLLFSASLHTQAQQAKDTIPAYQKEPLPSFNIMVLPDSTKFSKADIENNKAVIVVFFSPDCEHCKHFTKQLVEKYDSLKQAKIIMVSSLDFSIIRKFYTENKIADYPAITMGRDANYFFGTYFTIRSFPGVAVYDKHGKFQKFFNGTASIEEIIKLL